MVLVIAAAMAGMLVSSAPRAAVRLVRTRPILRCEVIVILGGGSLERIWTGLELHADGACDKVLITGHPVGERFPRIEAGFQALDPHDRLLPDTVSTSTFEDAVLASRIARREGMSNVLVLTSPYHTRRTIWVFSRVLDGTGIEFGVLPSQSFYFDYRRWWASSVGRGVVASEYVKLWVHGLAAQAITLGFTLGFGTPGHA